MNFYIKNIVLICTLLSSTILLPERACSDPQVQSDQYNAAMKFLQLIDTVILNQPEPLTEKQKRLMMEHISSTNLNTQKKLDFLSSEQQKAVDQIQLDFYNTRWSEPRYIKAITVQAEPCMTALRYMHFDTLTLLAECIKRTICAQGEVEE